MEEPQTGTVPAPPLKVITWAARGYSVVKPKNDVFGQGDSAVLRPNEDRFRIEESDDGLLAAISDGAGASGLYCGPWAQSLVEHLPDAPFPNRSAASPWMGGFWREFADDAKRQAADTPTKHTKLVREGSCATLTACWLRKGDEGVNLHWIGYGDSPLCVFEWQGDEPVLTACHPTSLAKFDQAPHLLNWKDLPQKAHIHGGVISLPARATVVLASDGIGQFILLRFLSGLNVLGAEGVPEGTSRRLLDEFRKMLLTESSKLSVIAQKHLLQPHTGSASDLESLRASLESQEVFAASVRDWNELGLMPNDDATMIVIDVQTSDVEEVEQFNSPEPSSAPSIVDTAAIITIETKASTGDGTEQEICNETEQGESLDAFPV